MGKFFNEMTADGLAHNASAEVREHYREFCGWLQRQSPDTIERKRAEADLTFRRVGITFAVYGDDAGTERLIPFDTIPRIITAAEWKQMEAGLVQRVKALNMFIHDIYHDQNIVKAGLIPAEQIYKNAQYRPEMQGINVASDIYAHIAGVDIVRAGEGEFYVLEDNLRVPSGVSYMLEDRKMMMRLFPELFARNKIAPVDHYPDLLLDNLRSVAPMGITDPVVVVMTPGMYNSAYFEHAFLAQRFQFGIAEHLFGAMVPADQEAIGIDFQQGVGERHAHHGPADAAQPLQLFLQPRQSGGLLRPSLFTGVLGQAQAQRDLRLKHGNPARMPGQGNISGALRCVSSSKSHYGACRSEQKDGRNTMNMVT